VQQTTFPSALRAELARDGSRPAVTFYDDATGERVELSLVTYANWVAKTAGLLQDELGLDRGARILVDLPCHWLATVWLGAAWSVGAVVVTGAAPDEGFIECVACGPGSVPHHRTHGEPVLAMSLLPMAARFRDPLPAGVTDFGEVVWGQPDAFVPIDPPEASDAAWERDGTAVGQEELLDRARTGRWSDAGTRLMTDTAPTSADGPEALLGPLLAGGGTVWVRNADPARWQTRAEQERVTCSYPGRAPQPPRS
jgi:uncharacterized protein (TIGR03089 family)